MPDALSVNSVTCGAFFGLARNLFDESLIMCQFCLEKEQRLVWHGEPKGDLRVCKSDPDNTGTVPFGFGLFKALHPITMHQQCD